MKQRSGFALITVLWVLVAMASIAAAGAAAGFDASAATKNRINDMRAHWKANSCAERARFVIDATLGDAVVEARDSLWRAMNLIVEEASEALQLACAVRLVSSGMQLDVNSATEVELNRLFSAAAVDSEGFLTAALLDWRDPDDETEALGAERAWYEGLERRAPRNGPIAAISELRYVRGFARLDVDSLLGVDSARISLATAPLPVLATLPGFSAEVLGRIEEWRLTGRQITSLLVFAGSLSRGASEVFMASFPEITRRSTIDPEWWTVIATGTAGFPTVSATVELRLTRAQSRAALIRRRNW